ncbi:MAG TPA: DUF4190 domain-containing protein, partial [Terrimesophilobacter sp.]|uniref:DUF4190 domain-containing protein n=1 Tax=Terrimesophilobacter sp. TaxID=2906435 RepID=UPI002F951503
PNPYAPQGGVAYPAAPPRGLSITSMVLGIVSLVGFFLGGGLLSIGAIIFGHIALRREPTGRGMAIAGLATGYVGLGVGFLLFLLILIPLLTLIAGSVAVAGTSV